MPADDEYFQEFHSHVYGPVGIFLMDIRGHRITGDGIQKSENPTFLKCVFFLSLNFLISALKLQFTNFEK